MILPLCACGEKGKDPAKSNSGLLVGFAEVDITPEDPVPMAIYGDEKERISTGFLDYLSAYALAITGTNGETVLIMTVDHSWFNASIAEQVRSTLGKEFDMPGENFILTGTHNHSAPNVSSTATKEALRYRESFITKVMDLGRQAMADRKSATMYTGSTEAKSLNFVRRYVLKDGTYPNFQKVESDLIDRHESEPDAQLQVLKFVREDGKDIAVFNWQAHANIVMQNKEKYNLLSADIFGNFREEIEKNLDVHCFIWQGAAGNLNPLSQIDGEQLTDDHKEYGKLLSKYGIEAYNGATEADAGEVRVATMTYVGEVNHSFDSVVKQASGFVERAKQTGNSDFVREEGKPYGINTIKHANRIIANEKLGKTEDIPLKAFCVGNVGFICLFYEMFDTNGMQIKKDSHFKQTFIIGYNESGLGYIPSALVEDHGANIYMSKGQFHMYDGTITAGVAGSKGGNVMLLPGNNATATFEMHNGTISGGLTSGQNAKNGGNICVNANNGGAARFTMNNGTVSGGVASEKGGNIFLYSSKDTVIINGGSVTGGTAVTGSCIYNNNNGNLTIMPGATVDNVAP